MPIQNETHLLLIDPQNDFCDIPGAALPVAGAVADMTRLAALMERAGRDFAAIHVTLDSHHPVDIAHPGWWEDDRGATPAPFTLIRAADVAQGGWRARDPEARAHSQRYVEALEAGGRQVLVVWPEHCLLGGWGHNVYAPVKTALDAWARAGRRQVNYVIKGTNPGTEHYSAFAAEVPDPADVGTEINAGLVARLAAASEIVIAGEALSHCVAASVRDLAAQLGPEACRRITLLTDCSSAVPGFESLAEAFVEECRGRGMHLLASTEWRLGAGR